ncbi:MAG: Gfo/Idh/MocA family oxidoreductase, partial [Paracoccaceae bacterium]|nr:Gfo/Idh/MocA family oxidoreductase [Paracoccaceae bacterium]
YLLGAVSSVQAITSDKYRGFEVEDTAGVVMQFESGAIATLSISDTIVAPWSYELTAGENPAYPQTGQSSYLIGGTKGALEMPAGRLWRNPGKRGWWEEIGAQDLAYDRYDPLTNQVEHLCAVVRKEVEPKVTGQDGLMTLLALAAIRQSAETGQRVAVDLSGG